MDAPRLTQAQVVGKAEEVLLPELGGTVLVHGLTRAEMRLLWEKAGIPADEGQEVDTDLVDFLLAALGVVDPPLADTLDGAVDVARSMSAGTLGRIVARVMWLSGLRGLIVPPGQTKAVPAGPFPSGASDDDRQRDVPGTSDSP